MRMSNDRNCCKKAKYDRYFVGRTASYDSQTNKTTYNYYLGKTAFKIEEGGSGVGGLDTNGFALVNWAAGNSISSNDWQVLLDTVVCDGNLNDYKKYGNYNISVYADTTDEYVHILIKYIERPRFVPGVGLTGDSKDELRLITVHAGKELLIYNKTINLSLGSLTIDRNNLRVGAWNGTPISEAFQDNDYAYVLKNPTYLYNGSPYVINQEPLYMLVCSSKIILTSMTYKYANRIDDQRGVRNSVIPPSTITNNLYIWIEIDSINGTLLKEKIGYTDYLNKFQIIGRETKLLQDLEHIVGVKFTQTTLTQGYIDIATGELDYDVNGNPYIKNPATLLTFVWDRLAPFHGFWTLDCNVSWGQDANKNTYVCFDYFDNNSIETVKIYKNNTLISTNTLNAVDYLPKAVKQWIEPCFLDGYILVTEWLTPDTYPLTPGQCIFQCFDSNNIPHWSKTFIHSGDYPGDVFWLYGPWHFIEHGALYCNDKYVQFEGITVDLKDHLTDFNATIDSKYKYNQYLINPSYIDQNTNGITQVSYWNIVYGFVSPIINVVDPENSPPGSFYRDLSGNIKPEYQNKIVYRSLGYDIGSNVSTYFNPENRRLNIIRLSGLPDVYFSASD